MTKRYLFWRMPDGRPYRGQDGKCAPTEALAEYGRVSNVDANGNVSWRDFTFGRLEVALKLAAVIVCSDGTELNESDSWAILRSALRDAVKKRGGRQALDSKEVCRLADARADAYFREAEIPYTLVSSLSVESLPFQRTTVDNCRIESLRSRQKYPFPAVVRTVASPAIENHVRSSLYKLVRVSTSGRSFHAAVDKALHALHLLRGLWTLFATYGSWTISFGGIHERPIGVIHTGPIHTLHNADRTLVGDWYWYERAGTQDRKLFRPSHGWTKIEKNRRWAMNRMRALPFNRDVEDLIVRYANALDETDHDVAFLKMWTIMERLTNTIGANYDETVRRIIWMSGDKALAKDLLECVRVRRNLYVHGARSPEDPDQSSYLIKSFVEPHLIQIIRNDFGVASLEEYGQVLSLPTDVRTLARNKRWIAKAIRWKSRKAAKP